MRYAMAGPAGAAGAPPAGLLRGRNTVSPRTVLGVGRPTRGGVGRSGIASLLTAATRITRMKASLLVVLSKESNRRADDSSPVDRQSSSKGRPRVQSAKTRATILQSPCLRARTEASDGTHVS